ncbi:glycoside hydrolase family 88 protein [Massilia forsythiae]|uniref:Glycoside hydrolase family 88 protein n=1 Tax=Massilia forsythiae TaxID=2728020 RepID=A0A7Z2ZVD1_9BURK|nr:glycoside hydrolase family 88 protein [Massilia forsythiae]QJE01962.1 glycoside hydrolase family 88 protein [Massilia forsythiae]
MKHMIALAAIAAAACAPHGAATAQNYPLPTPAQQAIVDKDTSRHFGDAPAAAGPYATDLSPALEPAAIDKALRKVADWQLARSQPHWDRIWTSSVMYVGFLAASNATGDPKYRNAMLDMARHFDFQLRSRLPNADDLSIGQVYLDLYRQDRQASMLNLTKQEMDDLLPLATLKPGDARIPWWWCDALFMAPPVWVKLYKITGERKYLDYVHLNWKRTSDLLYDREEHLYARDAGYKDKREANGKKVFWSRGEGWVMGGLALILDDIPADDPQRGFYVQQLREMAEKIASIQGADGLWHAGLLDPASYPLPEISGSSLFVYAMAYGVNRGILDASKYRPVIAKAWAGMLRNVYADGRLGNIQQTGAEPAFYRPTSSFNYGVGAFMLAASELKAMAAGGKR